MQSRQGRDSRSVTKENRLYVLELRAEPNLWPASVPKHGQKFGILKGEFLRQEGKKEREKVEMLFNGILKEINWYIMFITQSHNIASPTYVYYSRRRWTRDTLMERTKCMRDCVFYFMDDFIVYQCKGNCDYFSFPFCLSSIHNKRISRENSYFQCARLTNT